jgi:ubiquitin C-terminal hydrolase
MRIEAREDRRMSPILDAFGGALEKIYDCTACEYSRTVLENFVSLSFDRLTLSELLKIRTKFEERNYNEGLQYIKTDLKKTSLFDKLRLKKTQSLPLITLRDFFCHLNFTMSDNL